MLSVPLDLLEDDHSEQWMAIALPPLFTRHLRYGSPVLRVAYTTEGHVFSLSLKRRCNLQEVPCTFSSLSMCRSEITMKSGEWSNLFLEKKCLSLEVE